MIKRNYVYILVKYFDNKENYQIVNVNSSYKKGVMMLESFYNSFKDRENVQSHSITTTTEDNFCSLRFKDYNVYYELIKEEVL